MWPLVSIIAGTIMQKMQEQEQRKQALGDLYMSRARELNPQTPMHAYNAQKFNSQMDANGGAMVSKLLPLALQMGGSMFGGGADSGQGQAWSQYGQGQNAQLSDAFRQAQPIQPINPFRGLDGSEGW